MQRSTPRRKGDRRCAANEGTFIILASAYNLYDRAGTFRKINISKKGTLFADHTKLEELSDSIFSRLKRLDFLKGMYFSEIDKDMLMISTIQAAQGINDNLKSIFAKAVKKHCRLIWQALDLCLHIRFSD